MFGQQLLKVYGHLYNQLQWVEPGSKHFICLERPHRVNEAVDRISGTGRKQPCFCSLGNLCRDFSLTSDYFHVRKVLKMPVFAREYTRLSDVSSNGGDVDIT